MEGTTEIICITCPKGCRAGVSEEGGELRIKGKICKKGKEYVLQEHTCPMRMLTTTVSVDRSRMAKRLPVRTRGPIPRTELFAAMRTLAGIRVQPPLKMGDVIVENIVSGVDVVASDDLPR